MLKRHSLLPLLILGVLLGAARCLKAQQDDSNVTVFHVSVNLVDLDVAVMDKKGHHVSGLSPYEFEIYEDGIRQKIATFAEENEAPRKVEDFKPGKARPAVAVPSPARPAVDSGNRPDQTVSPVAGAKVFILFDTSNYMYRGFVFAQDAISQFVRTLDHPDRVAYYTYSRNFFRACHLTPDRSVVLRSVRRTTAGDDAALYDSLLSTLKDAGRFSGKRVVLVFSNGPDNSSVVSPEDVRDLAQSEGIPIYMISTREAENDPLSTSVFKRVSAATGGKAYFAKNWLAQQKAFASVRDDLAQLLALGEAASHERQDLFAAWRLFFERLADTVHLMAKDLSFVMDRNGDLAFRGNGGSNGRPGEVRFTRSGSDYRSGVAAGPVTVGYRLRDGKLEQLVYPPDWMLDGRPEIRPLLSGQVTDLRFRFRDRGGAWHDQWPVETVTGLPSAVEIRLRLADDSRLTRVVAIP